MTFSTQHDIGSQIKAIRASDNASAIAGGTGDNTLVTGQIIDRMAYGLPLSCAFIVDAKAVLGDGNKLTIKSVLIEHGDDSALGDATNYLTPADVVLLLDPTGVGGGSTMRGQAQYNVDLAGSKRYLRLKFTPDLDAANTDTAELSSILVFGGFSEVPTPGNYSFVPE